MHPDLLSDFFFFFFGLSIQHLRINNQRELNHHHKEQNIYIYILWTMVTPHSVQGSPRTTLTLKILKKNHI